MLFSIRSWLISTLEGEIYPGPSVQTDEQIIGE